MPDYIISGSAVSTGSFAKVEAVPDDSCIKLELPTNLILSSINKNEISANLNNNQINKYNKIVS